MGALAWGDVAIARACESLHHSVTQMSVFSQKYTQIKVMPSMAAAAVLACDSACASSTLQVMVASVALLYKWLRQ